MERSPCQWCHRLHAEYADPERVYLLQGHQPCTELWKQTHCWVFALEDELQMPSSIFDSHTRLPLRPAASLESQPTFNSAVTPRLSQRSLSASYQVKSMPIFPVLYAPTANYSLSLAPHVQTRYDNMPTAAFPDGYGFNNEMMNRVSNAPEPDESTKLMTWPNETAQRREARLDEALNSLARSNSERKRRRSDLEDEADRRNEEINRENRFTGFNNTDNRQGVTNSYMLGQNYKMTQQNGIWIRNLDAERREKKVKNLQALFQEHRELEQGLRFWKQQYDAKWAQRMELHGRKEWTCPHEKQNLRHLRECLTNAFMAERNSRLRLQDLGLLPTNSRLQPSQEQDELEKIQEVEQDKKAHEAAKRQFNMLGGLAPLGDYNRRRREQQQSIAVMRRDRPAIKARREKMKRRARRLEAQLIQTTRLELREKEHYSEMAERGQRERSTRPRLPKWKWQWSIPYRPTLQKLRTPITPE